MPIIAVRVTQKQALELRATARLNKRSVSDHLRALAFPHGKPKGECRITGRPGRMVIVPPEGTRKITSEEVRAILEEMS
jgi:hypothetical protein